MPSEITEFEDKLPAALDLMLHKLYAVKDALRRHGFIEAIRHTGDLQTAIQNESDWCYRTDRVLPYMQQTALLLGDAIGALQTTDSVKRADAVDAIICVIEDLQLELQKHMSVAPAWQAPDASVDYLEKQHRARTYYPEKVTK